MWSWDLFLWYGYGEFLRLITQHPMFIYSFFKLIFFSFKSRFCIEKLTSWKSVFKANITWMSLSFVFSFANFTRSWIFDCFLSIIPSPRDIPNLNPKIALFIFRLRDGENRFLKLRKSQKMRGSLVRLRQLRRRLRHALPRIPKRKVRKEKSTSRKRPVPFHIRQRDFLYFFFHRSRSSVKNIVNRLDVVQCGCLRSSKWYKFYQVLFNLRKEWLTILFLQRGQNTRKVIFNFFRWTECVCYMCEQWELCSNVVYWAYFFEIVFRYLLLIFCHNWRLRRHWGYFWSYGNIDC